VKIPLLVAGVGALAMVSPLRGSGPQDLTDWRKPDANGLSCSSCHSPDGIEIRSFNFGREDILRRALGHHPADIANRLADFLAASTKASDATTVRPLQPGDRLLEGKSAEERDDAFGQELQDRLPTLCGRDIQTKEAAFAARDEVLALDPRTLAVGIRFNVLSEDGFHGAEHSTVADWIPDVPIPNVEQLIPLQDAYLSDPTDVNLEALDSACAKLVPKSSLEQLAVAKYRSLLLLQHSLRLNGPDGYRMEQVKLVGHDNAPWKVAEAARQMSDSSGLTMPKTSSDKKLGVPFQDQMRDLRLPWYWMAWCLDPGMQNSGTIHQIRRGDYFSKALWKDGPYPFHLAFMLTKRLVEQGCHPADTVAKPLRHYAIQYSDFVDQNPLNDRGPADPESSKRFRQFTMNSFRLSLFLLEDDIVRTGACITPEGQSDQISIIRRYFADFGSKADLDLCDRVAKELKSALVDYR
jgi:hypothetical protein